MPKFDNANLDCSFVKTLEPPSLAVGLAEGSGAVPGGWSKIF